MPHRAPVVAAIVLVALVVSFTALARRLPVPTPIIQMVAGFLVAMLPGVAIPDLDPDLVFFVFLPPVLWSAAMFTSVRDFKRNLGAIGTLAIGLVFVTTAVVAVAAHLLLPGMPWAVAVALGAIVSPPDALRDRHFRQRKQTRRTRHWIESVSCNSRMNHPCRRCPR